MKKNFYLILSVLGIGLGVFGIFNGWAGVHLPIAGVTMPRPSMEMWQAIATLVMFAAFAGALFKMPKFAVIPAVLAILLPASVMLIGGGGAIELKPMFGLYLSMGGGLLATIGALLAPKG